MELRKFNNKVVTITDVDNKSFEGICLFEDKGTFDEEYDALSVKTSLRWMRLFENEILKVEIADKIGQSKIP
ncbi:hypothetical protein [Streptococcus oralis]|uniref:hypothetical protein n=1 Tax=Streptococcus oralis TaxID=1303 RepID=UPI0035664E57